MYNVSVYKIGTNITNFKIVHMCICIYVYSNIKNKKKKKKKNIGIGLRDQLGFTA